MKIKKTDPIKTVLVISIGFLVIFLFTEWKWALYVSLVVGLAGIISNFLAEKIDFVWMKLAWVLSFIIPNILLSGVFYLVLFPVSTLSKIFGTKDPLSLKNTRDSLFNNSDKTFKPDSFEKTW